MPDQRNLFLAVVLSIGIILAFQLIYEKPRQERLQEQAQEQAAPQGEAVDRPRPEAPDTAPSAESGAPAAAKTPVADRESVLAQGRRVRIESARLTGSIALTGARIDDVTLVDYREEVDPESPQVTMLVPPGLPNAYFAEFGWVADDARVPVPTPDTEWRADVEVLRPDRPVTFFWDNGEGLRFVHQIVLDENFLFTVIRRVENNGADPVTLFSYGLVARSGTPELSPFGFYVHEGPVGMINGTLEEIDYDDLEAGSPREETSQGGWFGIKDLYWLVALVPDQEGEIKVRFKRHQREDGDKYQVDFLSQGITVPARGSIEVTERLFVGAKEIELLEKYGDELDIENFNMAIDYTKLFFLTIPLHKVLSYFNGILGNFGLSILLLTVFIKAIFFPLANKSYRAMSAMKKLQPQMTELRELYGEDKQRMNQELMALYKREKVNPAAGCLPIIIQIPVFISLYIVVLVTIDVRHAPFFGWIRDLSAPDPLGLLTLFGLLDWQPDGYLAMLNIGIWPMLMGITMFLQQKLNPQPADPMQAKIFMALPFVFTVMLSQFPAALVIYWAWNNLLSIAQQWVIMRRYGAIGTPSPASGAAASAAAPANPGPAPGDSSIPKSSTKSDSKPKPKSKSKSKPKSKTKSKPKSKSKS